LFLKWLIYQKKGAWFTVFLGKMFCFFHIVWFKVICFIFPNFNKKRGVGHLPIVAEVLVYPNKQINKAHAMA
jgi:hypothetical protein